MTEDGSGVDSDGRGDGDDRPVGDGGGVGGEHSSGERTTLSADGAYALLWSVVSILAAALSFDGFVDLVVGLAGFAGAVGVFAVARDVLRRRPPSGLEFLWMGTPALLAAVIAVLDGHLLTAGGLGVVAVATLVEGYGWFGAGGDEDGDERDEADANERDGNADGDAGT